ncbi:hypothetical protein MASSI9I_50546 [Massilia sp. 9I]|nr:hypothetical protein MASSI9I_50546 [Massilia sp. 9I]
MASAARQVKAGIQEQRCRHLQSCRIEAVHKRAEYYAKNENQKLREEAFSRASGWYRQVGYGVQASHPDQEDHQKQASTARHP